MKIYTVKEISEIMAEQGYKYVSLWDQGGAQIIPFNPHKMTGSARLREIETRLLSKALKDGYYFIKCKNAIQNKVSDDYMVYKGESLSEPGVNSPAPPPILIQEKPVFQPEVLTYDGALKLQIDLERLKLENASLKKEIENLNSELSQIEEAQTLAEEENKTPELLETAKSFLSELVGFAAPLLDKHFELKEKALGLKAIELQARTNFAGKAKPSPEQRINFNVADWIATFEDQAETYNDLVQIYNQAQSVEDFYKNLKAFDENLFTNCRTYEQEISRS